MAKKVILEKGKYEFYFKGEKKIDIPKIRFTPDKKFLPRKKHLSNYKPEIRDFVVTSMKRKGLVEGRFRKVKK
jgi:hypothetical protein